MSKDRFVAVSEVEPPDFDVPVRWPRHQQCAVVGDIHTGDRELVSIQRQEKLHKVNVLVLIKRIYFQQEKHQGTCVHGIRSESSYICGPLASCHAA